MSKSVRKIIGTAAPLAGLLPGVGLPLAIGLGAGGGLLAGGGLRGAITGGLGGALTGGGAGLLGNAIAGPGTFLGGVEGFGAPVLKGLGGALLGGTAGGISGGLKGAAIAAPLAGVGEFAGAGGFDGALSSLGQYTDKIGLTGEGSILGTAASHFGEAGPALDGSHLSQPGTGILGATTRGLSDIGSAIGVGTGGGGSSYSGTGGGSGSSYSNLGLGAALLGGASSLKSNDDAEKALLDAQNNALGKLNPYLATGGAANSRLSELLGTGGDANAGDYGSLAAPFTPGDLTKDPGYEFQLDQGQRALDRKASASGGYFSGKALKDASAFGTGLADQTYKDAYARDAATKAQTYGMFSGQSGQGLSSANAAGNLYQGIGNARAGADISSSNIINNTLSSLLTGSGAKRFLGYGQNGQPIYV